MRCHFVWKVVSIFCKKIATATSHSEWSWRQQIPLKYLYLSTQLQSVNAEDPNVGYSIWTNGTHVQHPHPNNSDPKHWARSSKNVGIYQQYHNEKENITFCLVKYNNVLKAEVMCICTDFVFMVLSSLNALYKRKDIIRKSSRRILVSRDKKICHLVLCHIFYI